MGINLSDLEFLSKWFSGQAHEEERGRQIALQIEGAAENMGSPERIRREAPGTSLVPPQLCLPPSPVACIR